MKNPCAKVGCTSPSYYDCDGCGQSVCSDHLTVRAPDEGYAGCLLCERKACKGYTSLPECNCGHCAECCPSAYDILVPALIGLCLIAEAAFLLGMVRP